MSSSETSAALGVWEDPHGELSYSRAPNYERFAERATPEWFQDAKLGIFIHWGAYAVPAWAETLSKSGDLPPDSHYSHTPYSEWYFNTIRFPGLPAAEHHAKVYRNAPYDDFLDSWKAQAFDARDMVRLFKNAGASFLIPTSKHHDGITLWDAPGTNERNTVKTGPKRDFMAEWDQACQEEAIKFGVYYSTGIDWHFWPTSEPWDTHQRSRPGLEAVDYNEYAWKQCQDLIQRHKPYFLWGDVSWPEAGVAPGRHSVETLLDSLYEANPEALINDRFGKTHWDFKTEEYGMGVDPDKIDTAWQACRGIGLSFGYNQNEDDSHSMSPRQAIRFLLHVASRGGNLLLNVGPDAAGSIPAVQRRCLEGMGEWLAAHGSIDRTRRVGKDMAKPVGIESGDETVGKEWVRWLKSENEVSAYIDSDDPQGQVRLIADWEVIDRTSAQNHGEHIAVGEDGLVDVSLLTGPMPGRITFRLSGR